MPVIAQPLMEHLYPHSFLVIRTTSNEEPWDYKRRGQIETGSNNASWTWAVCYMLGLTVSWLLTWDLCSIMPVHILAETVRGPCALVSNWEAANIWWFLMTESVSFRWMCYSGKFAVLPWVAPTQQYVDNSNSLNVFRFCFGRNKAGVNIIKIHSRKSQFIIIF